MNAVIIAILVIGGISLIFGILLAIADKKLKVKGDPLADQLNDLLPQTQCGQCGYPGCRPYAEALSNGDDINKCAPGGELTIKKIADLLGVEPIPPAGESEGSVSEPIKMVAFIHEADCIGCTKCIQACPVDAIMGATRQMHTVISKECTGCELCVAPCPTDCIEMIPSNDPRNPWQWQLDGIAVKVIDEADI